MDSKGRFRKHGFRLVVFGVFLCIGMGAVCSGQADELVLPAEFKAIDTPHDAGDSILLVWSRSPSEETRADKGLEYVVYEALSPGGPFWQKAIVGLEKTLCSDAPAFFGFSPREKNFRFKQVSQVDKETGEVRQHWYKLGIKDEATTPPVMLERVVTAKAKMNYFMSHRTNNLVTLVVMAVLVLFCIQWAKRNPNLFIRRIPGIDAVDEAIGRATEMGKPILYLTGYSDIDTIATIASINILAHVAKKVAQYDSRLIVPNKWAVTMTLSQEVVKQAYINAGRPDAYNANDIFFIAGEQFSYVAAVDGMMVREKPATNFFLGSFAAESLLLAETGFSIGALQIAGTDSTYQIPFFVTACDYCLIGEELYAASAYLSRDTRLLGNLKGQDITKIILTILILVGALLVSFNVFYPEQYWLLVIKHLFAAL
jgi:hypothetical protein